MGRKADCREQRLVPYSSLTPRLVRLIHKAAHISKSDVPQRMPALPRKNVICVAHIDPTRLNAYLLAVTEAIASLNGDFMKETRA